MTCNIVDKWDSVLVVIDVQEKLLPPIYKKEEMVQNIVKCIKIAKTFNIPIIYTEQYPRGLGRTVPEIKGLIRDVEPVEKVVFSCFGSNEFGERLKGLWKNQLLVTGTETHVCVSQTVHDALDLGYKVHLISDACSSRMKKDHKIGIRRMRHSGAVISSTEMMLFEIAKKAGTPEFKEAQKLII